jgi:hypothetical protein
VLSRRIVLTFRCLLAFLLGLFFNRENGGGTFLRNVSKLLSHYTASHPRRQTNLCVIYPETAHRQPDQNRCRLDSATDPYYRRCWVQTSAQEHDALIKLYRRFSQTLRANSL